MTPEPTENSGKQTVESVHAELLRQILLPSVEKETRWIVRGLIGLSVTFICTGVLGVVAIVKSIFL